MQEVMQDDREIVAALRRILADKVGAERYDLWFASSAQFRRTATGVVVVVPNSFLQEWLRNTFRGQIEDAAREALGAEASVAFEIDPSIAPRRTDKKVDKHDSGTVVVERLGVGVGESRLSDGPTGIAAATADLLAARAEPAVVAPPRRPTVPRRLLRFEEFVIGTGNRLAYASALGCAERLGSISPLVIHGPTGVGKTHLLEAVVDLARRSHPELQTALISAEQFTTSFLESLHGAGLPSFRRKFRGLHLLAVDDLQFLAGKKATLGELVHTLDTLQREGKQVVFTADRSPAELNFLGPELRNRLAGGLVVGVEPPDMQARLGIAARMAARLGLALPPEVGEFVASRFTAHARELSGALQRLKAASRAFDRPIDLPLAEHTLAELIRGRQKMVRLADIEKAVCDVFGLEDEALRSQRKGKNVSHPRMLAMWLARKYTRAALSEIGHYFGGRSHSTVISAQKKVTGWMTSDEAISTAGGRCRFDEALRKVELAIEKG